MQRSTPDSQCCEWDPFYINVNFFSSTELIPKSLSIKILSIFNQNEPILKVKYI